MKTNKTRHHQLFDSILEILNNQTNTLINLDPQKRIKQRIKKFEKMGIYSD